MNNEFVIRKCLNCGAVVKVMRDCNCNCGFMCCNEKMEEVVSNSTDGAVEKHVPTYEVEDDILKVKVNHVMDEDHYIEWICLKSDDREETIFLKPNEDAVANLKL